MHFKKIARFFTKWQVQLAILLLHVVLSIIGLYNFLYNYKASETLLLQRSFEKQQVIAKSGAVSVENFINSISNQLHSFVFTFANVEEKAIVDKKATRQEFIDYIKNSKIPVNEVAFYDELGTLQVLENSLHLNSGEGQNFSDYDFIQWSKDPFSGNKIFISHPYIAKVGILAGRRIMTIATPLYFGKKLKGTLTMRFLVEDFTNVFINPLISDLNEDAYIVDSNGTVLAGNNQLLNQNLLEFAQTKNWKGSKEFITRFKSLLTKNNSNISWIFQYPNDKPRTYLVSSSKIDIPDTESDLFLIVSSSRSQAIQPISSLRFYGSLWIWISIIITFTGGILYIIMKQLSIDRSNRLIDKTSSPI